MAQSFGNFESDLHALLSGAITAALDFRNLASALGVRILVSPYVDERGHYEPEWLIEIHIKKVGWRSYLLRLEERDGQETPTPPWAAAPVDDPS